MKRTLKVLVGMAALGFMQSCTNLDEELYSQIAQDNYYQDINQFNAAVGPAYSALRGIVNDQFNLQTVTTDEGIVPTRGNDWYDAGRWQDLFKHTWRPDINDLNGAWNFSYTGIGRVNQLLYQFNQIKTDVPGKAQIIAELKALRAYFYFAAMDNFGGVPLVTDFADTAPKARATRTEVFNFVEKELKDNLASLPAAGSSATYAKMTQEVAYALLTKLYLNAQVYTGTPRWDDAIAAADKVISGGKFSLEPNYFANFATQNEGSKENIFVVPFDQTYAPDMNFQMRTLHYGNKSTYQLSGDSPWNGFATLAERYDAYTPGDARLGNGRSTGFLIGPQYGADGKPIKESDTGRDVVFTKEIPNIAQATQSQGIRVLKYELLNGSQNNRNNDFVVLRYGDVLLMKAEALMRKAGGTATADVLTLVNQIRTRSNAAPLTAAQLTTAEFLNERGREFYWEGWRRNDLIRFGRYNVSLPNRTDPAGLQEYRNLFPIPKQVLDNNKLLTQNPGY